MTFPKASTYRTNIKAVDSFIYMASLLPFYLSYYKEILASISVGIHQIIWIIITSDSLQLFVFLSTLRVINAKYKEVFNDKSVKKTA